MPGETRAITWISREAGNFGRVLELASGSDALSVWYTNDASDPSLNGLVWQGDALFTNTYNGNHLIRIPAITVIKDRFMLPTAVTVVGNTASVWAAKLNDQRDPALKDKNPGVFTAYAVTLK
jgi:hypothetical protein